MGDWTLFNWGAIQTDADLPEGIIFPLQRNQLVPRQASGRRIRGGETYAFYRITAEYAGKRDGEWVLIPLGANGENATPPADPVVVNGRLATLTDVVMDVQFEKSNYLPGEPVKITVSLFEGGLVQASHTVGAGPIIGAANGIKAMVTLPGGSTAEVPFTEVGNGVYTGTFANTQAKGTYEFAVTANGTAPVSGDKFFREFDQSVYVAPVYAAAAIFAQKSVVMQNGSSIVTGDILVNEPLPPGSQSVSLLVGAGASTPGGYDLKADRIKIESGASVASVCTTTRSQTPLVR